MKYIVRFEWHQIFERGRDISSLANLIVDGALKRPHKVLSLVHVIRNFNCSLVSPCWTSLVEDSILVLRMVETHPEHMSKERGSRKRLADLTVGGSFVIKDYSSQLEIESMKSGRKDLAR